MGIQLRRTSRGPQRRPASIHGCCMCVHMNRWWYLQVSWWIASRRGPCCAAVRPGCTADLVHQVFRLHNLALPALRALHLPPSWRRRTTLCCSTPFQLPTSWPTLPARPTLACCPTSHPSPAVTPSLHDHCVSHMNLYHTLVPPASVPHYLMITVCPTRLSYPTHVPNPGGRHRGAPDPRLHAGTPHGRQGGRGRAISGASDVKGVVLGVVPTLKAKGPIGGAWWQDMTPS